MAGAEGVNRQLTILERVVDRLDPNTAKQQYESLLLDDAIAGLTPEEYEAFEPRIDNLGERIQRRIEAFMLGQQQPPEQPQSQATPARETGQNVEVLTQQIEDLITKITTLRPVLAASLANPAFNPDTLGFNGNPQSATQQVRALFRLIEAAQNDFGRLNFDNRSKVVDVEEKLNYAIGELRAVEMDLSKRQFELWVPNVDTNLPTFGNLKVTTANINAQLALPNPNFGLINPAQAEIDAAQAECDAAFKGIYKQHQHLENNYLAPAQAAIDALKAKQTETNETARLLAERDAWWNRPDIRRLTTALNAVMKNNFSDVDNAKIAPMDYATAVATRSNINDQYRAAKATIDTSFPTPPRPPNQHIEGLRRRFPDWLKMSDDALTKHIDNVGYAEWNADPLVTALKTEIDRINAIDINAHIAPNCVAGGPCYDLAALTNGAPGFENQLGIAETNSVTAGLLNPDNGSYKESTKVKTQITKVLEKIREARSHLDKCKEKARQAAEMLVNINDVRARIDYLWDQIAAAEKNEQGNQNVYEWIHKPYVPGKHVREAGLIPLVEEFLPPNEQERWKLMIKLHNAFWAALSGSGSNQDPFAQMYYKIALESRSGAAGYIDFPELKKFAGLAEIQPLVNKVKEIYNGVGGNGVYRYMNNGRQYEHDFGKNGNPNSAQVADGYLSLSELLQREFPAPATSPSMIKAVIYWSMLSEGRLHYYRKYYANYLKTAEGSFDTSIISLHSPLATLLYKIRGYGVIPADLMLLWQVLRLPVRSGIFTEEVGTTSKVNRDRDLKRRVPKLGARMGELVFTGQPALVEHQPTSTPDSDKSRSFTSCRNVQVAEAIEVRSLRDMALTKYDDRFAGVPVDDDLTIIPTPWELINDAVGQYGPISFADYNLCLNAWKEFIKVAQSPASISRIEDVNDRISTLVGKIAPFKGFLAMMPRNTRKGETFRLLLQQVLLRATKQLYDDYATKANYPLKDRVGRPLTKKMYFLNVAISTYRGLGTADPDLAEFMVAELTKELSVGNTVFTGLFDDARQDITSFIYAGMDGRRRESLLEKYSKEEPPDAKGK